MKRFFGRFFATIGFLIVLLSLSLLAYNTIFKSKDLSLQDATVLVIDVSNTIPDSPADFNFASLMEGPRPRFYKLLQAIQTASQDPRISAIAINIEQPKMGLSQLYEMREALKHFRKQGKPIYAYCTTLGDLSPGLAEYYIASVADKIWLQPFSGLNLTGIHVDQPYFGKLLRKFDINPQIYARTVYKNAYSFITNEHASKEELEANQHLITQLYKTLSTGIEASRELRSQMIHDIAQQHPMMSDNKAIELGLIDDLKYKDEFIGMILTETAASGSNAVPLSVSQKTSLFKHPRLVSLSAYALLLKPEKPKKPTKIAIIYGSGTIMQERAARDIFGRSDTLSAKDIEKQFDQALSDPDVRAIVFRIDSPGGSAVASESIRRMVTIARSKSIPVIASFGNYAASGGYWIAASCDKILATPLTITGSIGALGGKITFRAFLEQHDINVSSYSTGDNGSLWSPLSPYTQEQDRYISQTMDRLYARFIKIVAEGRNLSLDHVSEIAKGRVWSGRDALQFGLIDEFGGLMDALMSAANMIGVQNTKDIEIIEYPKTLSLRERLQAMLTGDTSDLQEIISSLKSALQMMKMTISPNTTLMETVRVKP